VILRARGGRVLLPVIVIDEQMVSGGFRGATGRLPDCGDHRFFGQDSLARRSREAFDELRRDHGGVIEHRSPVGYDCGRSQHDRAMHDPGRRKTSPVRPAF